MKHSSRVLCRLLFAAAVVAPVLVVVPLAQAFTIDDKGSASSSGSASSQLTDPAQPDSRFGTGSGDGTYRSGNFSLQFNSRGSFDQRYDNSRMFDPIGRPGDPR